MVALFWARKPFRIDTAPVLQNGQEHSVATDAAGGSWGEDPLGAVLTGSKLAAISAEVPELLPEVHALDARPTDES